MKVVHTNQAPEAIGPYSQAIIFQGLVFTSGQIAINPATGKVEEASIEGQTEQVMKNLDAILTEAGSDLEHIIKTLVFVKDINDFQKFNEAYKKFFPRNPPARSTMQVGNFIGDMVIEIEAIAVCK